MHPKLICDEMAKLGSPIVMDGGNLYVENADKVPAHDMDLARSYKARIVKYLMGTYSDKEHALRQTNDKIIAFMLMENQDKTTEIKLDKWLTTDEHSYELVTRWLQKLAVNGWVDAQQSIANYETLETDKIAVELFDRAMSFFKKVRA
ncbi:hypothetical protein [Brevibacillus sp. DP1.3A]|uniref:hypothetical protein n=1 Tax=Brevibacillus sp. DP1.3A TaxID=2738867 RepID=UPI00156B6867|nr:hypothetical protein [Brevibacillus sp. DP1.3A]UED76081.1 hypothetical protein HP399_006190 [Brevibacillus sp. DP1.3A]